MNKASSAKVFFSEGWKQIVFVFGPLFDDRRHSKTTLRAKEDADTSISGSHKNGHRYRDLDSCRASQVNR